MSIYTRGGAKIKITEARIVPVWSVQSPGRISRVYVKPTKIKKDTTVYPMAIWHYKAVYEDDGKLVCDGLWVDASMLVADGGWSEIESVLATLNPNDNRLFDNWYRGVIKKDVESVFSPLKEKEVA